MRPRPSVFTRPLIALAVAVPMLSSAGCDHRDSKTIAKASWVPRDTARKLGAGDIRIVSVDTTVEVAIIGDSIVSGLTPQKLAEIQRDMAKDSSDTAKGGSFGASIAGFVKSTVSNALSHEIEYPLSEVSSIDFSDGRLTIHAKSGGTLRLFENNGHGRDSGKDTFKPEDARAFIAAFNAKKGGRV